MPARGFRFTEQQQKTISRGEFNKLAKAYGLPARSFWQITKGESGHKPFVQQHDPGDGMIGYGLFQLTPNAWGKGTAAMRKFEQLGGVQGMRDIGNQFEMARFLYKSAGKKFSPWYGTRYLSDRSEEGQLGPMRPALAAGTSVGGGGGGGGGRTQKRLQMGAVSSPSALQSMLTERPKPTISAPSLPGFAAQTAMPAGHTGVDTAGPPARRASLTEQLGELAAQNTPTFPDEIGGRKIRGSGGGGGGGVGGGGKAPRGTAEIHELFWNGPGAQNIDNGQRVGKGFVSGHTDHVHFAANRAAMKRAAKIAGQLGLSVGEYGTGISSGHATGSFHYQPYGAMDVSGDVRAMKKFARKVSRL